MAMEVGVGTGTDVGWAGCIRDLWGWLADHSLDSTLDTRLLDGSRNKEDILLLQFRTLPGFNLQRLLNRIAQNQLHFEFLLPIDKKLRCQ